MYCIVSIHLYSESCCARQSEALPVRETQREKRVVTYLITKAHGLPTSSLHEVTRATVLARLLYAAPAWRGFATVQDCSRIDRFINRTVNLGYLPSDCHTFNSLVNTAEDGCSPPLFATHTTFSARSSPYPHQTTWPLQASSPIFPALKR